MPHSPYRPITPVEWWRWRIVWLLFLATMLNYMDRQALNQTATFVLDEFAVPIGERETVYGNIESAFAYSFAFFQIVAGFLADRFRLTRLYLAALLIWSAAGFATGLVPAGAIAGLMICRVVLGFGEAFNWPCAVACVRRVVPRESRGLANGIFHSGASIGALATPLLVLALVGPGGEGWRGLFLVVGSAGLVWAALWLYATRGEPGRIIDAPPAADPDRPAGPDLPMYLVPALRVFWVMMAVGVTVNLCWHFFRIWFIRYQEKDLGISADDRQWLMFGFFIAADLGSMGSGYVIRRLTRAGYSVERSRKLVLSGLAAVCLLAIPATQVPGIAAKMVLFFLVAAGSMGGFAIFFSLAQDIVPRHTAKILGIGGATSWAVIAIANQIVGPAADSLGTFVPAIIAVSCVPLVGAVIGWLWPEPVRAS
jgi:ACS family hexuronate transporter-like MFS transporter